MNSLEPIAVNEFTLTKELFREGFFALFSQKRQKMLFTCGVVFAMAGLLFLLVQVLFHRIIVFGMPILIMGVGVMVWAKKLPNTEFHRKWYTFAGEQEEIQRKVEFLDSFIVVQSNGKKSNYIRYEDVIGVTETEHMLVFNCTEKRGILLKKDSFTSGNVSEVLRLIEKKAVVS